MHTALASPRTKEDNIPDHLLHKGRQHSKRQKTTFQIKDDDIPSSECRHLHNRWRTTFRAKEDDLPNACGRRPQKMEDDVLIKSEKANYANLEDDLPVQVRLP